MRRWRRSGLSAREYGEREGLKAATLYGWSLRLRREEKLPPARFIEVTPPKAASRPVLLRIGAVEIPVEVGFDPQLLRDVVTALVPS